ncbi:MAG TPA: HAMP domain-containing protein [Oligoflexus sp.]|uniref:HAMP domain-containing protein n=1 Tax=Oligoflexus sp. TaxID=1971216 RepID=UPI002D62B0F3|nr:HAMP domain-containing protein [Oligoflexus sp.]HYX33515.1 HAMP domain-containing protein [Oligoflexus sp.]
MSSKSIGTRILILIIGIVGLAFVTIGCIGGLAFRNLADGFLNIVGDQNEKFAEMLNRNSERARNRFISMFEENARSRGEMLITRDSLNLKTPFLENSYTQVREALQNSFNYDSTMLLASFVVIEDDQIKAWQYLDRDHKEGLSLPIVYDPSREVWVSNFQGQPILVYDPGLENLRTIEKATIRKVQVTIGSGDTRRTVAAYEAIIPISESVLENMPERLKEGEAIAYLRYLISLELLDQAISMEEKEMQAMLTEQQEITQSTLENTLRDANRRLAKLAVTLISTGIGVIILAFAISIWLSRRIAKPIEELSHAADKIAQGNYDAAVHIKSDDEIGRLGNSFESMRVQVKTFTEKLQVLVDERTARLNEALQTVTTQSQKIREIMGRIDQGILTIDVKQQVEGEYSQHLLSLYPKAAAQLPGISIMDLVFKGSTLSDEDLNLIQQSLSCCLDGDILNWDTNSDNFPGHVRYDVNGTLKTYEIRWSPIVDNDTIQRFLVTIRDKTQELVLQEQVRVAAQSSHRLTQALSDLVSVRSDAVGAMLRDSHASLRDIEESRDQQGAEHRRNYVRLHTMKGAARSLSLKALSLSIHEAEIYLQKFFNSGDFDAEGFEIALRVVREEIDFLRDVAGRILKIKIDDQGGETRTLFEMLAEELREADNLCRSHDVELGGLVVEDRVIQWNPRFLVDFVQASRHALANSLDHGYFKPIRDGKLNPDQKVFFRIAAVRAHGKVIITFEDEGFGFDRAAIRVLAERLGVKLNSDDDYMNVLLRDGLSTAKEVTQLSGRGAGLSAIQTFVEEWHGLLQLIDNQPRGSRIVVTLPEDQVLVSTFCNSLKDPASA